MGETSGGRIIHELEGPISIITIDNPPVNSITKQMKADLERIFKELAADQRIRVVIITGAGERSFCAGANLNEEERLNDETAIAFRDQTEKLLETIFSFPMPVIGAINGYTLGFGLSLAMACDLRIASENAKFGAVAANVGLTATSQQLVRAIGPVRAKEMAFTAQHIPAPVAEKWGLCNKVVPPKDLLPTCKEWAHTISSRAPLAIKYIKLEMNLSIDQTLEEGRKFARENWLKLRNTRDHQEAVRAFLEKRPPRFEGR